MSDHERPFAWIVDDGGGEGWYLIRTRTDQRDDVIGTAADGIGQTVASLIDDEVELLIFRAACFDDPATDQTMSEDRTNELGKVILAGPATFVTGGT